MTDVLVLLIATAVLAVVGIRVGMLLAPRFEHWGEPPPATAADDEAPSNHDDHP